MSDPLSRGSPPPGAGASLGTVLFVDDEPAVLRALQRSLRGAPFTVRVADGGEEALRVLAAEPVDAVVADVRMPVMDGVELLARVKKSWPLVRRTVLSGQVDRDTIVEALTSGVARSYVTKPWDDASLRAEIERDLLLRREMAAEGLLSLIASVETLPALPQVWIELSRALREGRSLRETAAIVEKDLALSAKVLQTINSAIHGRAPMASVERAMAMLGLAAVQSLALLTSFVEGMAWTPTQKAALDAVVTHGLLVQRVSTAVMRSSSAEEGEEAAAAGLLHDAGQVLVLRSLPERFAATVERMAAAPGASFLDAEAALGWGEASHARIGAWLLDSWNMPEAVVECALWHHEPARAPRGGSRVLRAVAWADRAVAAVRRREAPPPFPSGVLDPAAAERAAADCLRSLGEGAGTGAPSTR